MLIPVNPPLDVVGTFLIDATVGFRIQPAQRRGLESQERRIGKIKKRIQEMK
jgi:hypothetical protein